MSSSISSEDNTESDLDVDVDVAQDAEEKLYAAGKEEKKTFHFSREEWPESIKKEEKHQKGGGEKIEHLLFECQDAFCKNVAVNVAGKDDEKHVEESEDFGLSVGRSMYQGDGEDEEEEEEDEEN